MILYSCKSPEHLGTACIRELDPTPPVDLAACHIIEETCKSVSTCCDGVQLAAPRRADFPQPKVVSRVTLVRILEAFPCNGARLFCHCFETNRVVDISSGRATCQAVKHTSTHPDSKCYSPQTRLSWISMKMQ